QGEMARRQCMHTWWQYAVFDQRSLYLDGSAKGRSQRVGQVDGPAACSLFNLLTATEPVGNNQRVWRCLSYSRQQDELAHLHRHRIVVPFEAETACHAATARVEYIDIGAHVAHDRCFVVHRGNRLV